MKKWMALTLLFIGMVALLLVAVVIPFEQLVRTVIYCGIGLVASNIHREINMHFFAKNSLAEFVKDMEARRKAKDPELKIVPKTTKPSSP